MDTGTQSTVIIIAAIGSQLLLVIGALFNGWAALSARRIATDTKEETRAQTGKIDAVAKDTAVVLGHVNSEKSIDQGRIETLTAERDGLREAYDNARHTASLLAQSTAQASAPIPVEVVNGSDSPVPVKSTKK